MSKLSNHTSMSTAVKQGVPGAFGATAPAVVTPEDKRWITLGKKIRHGAAVRV